MQSPLTSPQGMLRNLLKVHENEMIYQMLLEAGQDYSLTAVDRLALPPKQRLQLLAVATQPPTLMHICRLKIRTALDPMRPTKVRELPLPNSMKSYLLYEYFIAPSAPKKPAKSLTDVSLIDPLIDPAIEQSIDPAIEQSIDPAIERSVGTIN